MVLIGVEVLRRFVTATLVAILGGVVWTGPHADATPFNDYVGVCQMSLTMSGPMPQSIDGTCTMLLQAGARYHAAMGLGPLNPVPLVGFGCGVGAATGSAAIFTLDTPFGQRTISPVHVGVVSVGGVIIMEADDVPEMSGVGVFPMGTNCTSPPASGIFVFEDPDPLASTLTPS